MSRRALILAGLLAAFSSLAVAGEETRDLIANVTGAGLEKIRIRAGLGELHVTAGGTEVAFRVRLKEGEDRTWFGRRRTANLASVVLRTNVQNNTLYLELTGNLENISGNRQVTLPAALAADLRLDVGDITVNGLQGGVSAQVNAGEIDTEVP